MIESYPIKRRLVIYAPHPAALDPSKANDRQGLADVLDGIFAWINTLCLPSISCRENYFSSKF
jgi:hypothetical protein